MKEKQIYNLVRYAFNKPDTEKRREAFQLLYNHSHIFTKNNDDTIESHLLATPFQMMIQHQLISMAGIGYVATLPEYRGNGGIKQLFNELFTTLDEKNIPLSFLAPFSQTFYRQFGYENVVEKTIYRFDNDLWHFLEKHKEGYYTRHLFDDMIFEAVQKTYHQTIGTLNGSLHHPLWWLKYKQLKMPETYVVFYDDIQVKEPLEAMTHASYMIYHISGDTFYIDELAYTERKQLIALLNFAKSHQMTIQHYVVEDPQHLIESIFSDTILLHKTTEPYMMARIHNLHAFDYIFKAYATDTPCYIEVKDDDYSQNHGYWEITKDTMKKIDTVPMIHYSSTIQGWTKWLLSSTPYHNIQYGTCPIACHHTHDMIQHREQHLQNQTIHLYDYF